MSIKLQASDKHFSSFGGLNIINHLIDGRGFGEVIEPFIPNLKSGNCLLYTSDAADE